MKVAVDTNILVRAVRLDDELQAHLARQLLRDATIVAIPLVVLCELSWVLRDTFGQSKREINAALAALITARNVVADREAVAIGLEFLAAGGDFADGVIAYDGRQLGGTAFASFDRQAKKLATVAGFTVHELKA